jgi:Co/Zn/Cd efflux system component
MKVQRGLLDMERQMLIEELCMIKVHDMHVWKCQNKINYLVQTICANKNNLWFHVFIYF